MTNELEKQFFSTFRIEPNNVFKGCTLGAKYYSEICKEETCKTGNDCKQEKCIFKDNIKLKQALAEIKEIAENNRMIKK